jgi:hypothetical protein
MLRERKLLGLVDCGDFAGEMDDSLELGAAQTLHWFQKIRRNPYSHKARGARGYRRR